MLFMIFWRNKNSYLMLDFLYFGAPFIYMPLSKEKADFLKLKIIKRLKKVHQQLFQQGTESLKYGGLGSL